MLVPNCRKQHHGIDRDSSTAELSAQTPSIEVRILVPQPTSPVSHLLFCDTRESAWVRAISQVARHSSDDVKRAGEVIENVLLNRSIRGLIGVVS